MARVAKAAAKAAPKAKRYAVESAQAAYTAGFLTAAQQFTNILVRGARSFGDAIDQYQKIEQGVAQKAQELITAELKGKGVKLDGFDFKLDNTPKGLFIELVPVQLPPEVQAQLAAQQAQAAKMPPQVRELAKKLSGQAVPKLPGQAAAPAAKKAAAKRAPLKSVQ
jgi:ribosomal protein L9